MLKAGAIIVFCLGATLPQVQGQASPLLGPISGRIAGFSIEAGKPIPTRFPGILPAPVCEAPPAIWLSLRLPGATPEPFFCRLEHRWGKGRKLPVKFRLGSVQYVDWLEGKPNAGL
jgi:hypothetical protein